jgi:hypothetical protein
VPPSRWSDRRIEAKLASGAISVDTMLINHTLGCDLRIDCACQAWQFDTAAQKWRSGSVDSEGHFVEDQDDAA